MTVYPWTVIELSYVENKIACCILRADQSLRMKNPRGSEKGEVRGFRRHTIVASRVVRETSILSLDLGKQQLRG